MKRNYVEEKTTAKFKDNKHQSPESQISTYCNNSHLVDLHFFHCTLPLTKVKLFGMNIFLQLTPLSF
jgi:hypothetical protein